MKKKMSLLVLMVMILLITILAGCENNLIDPDSKPMLITNFNINTEIGKETIISCDKIPGATIYKFGYFKGNYSNATDSNITFMEPTSKTSVSFGILEPGQYIGKVIIINESNLDSIDSMKSFVVENINEYIPSPMETFNATYENGEINYSWNYGYTEEIIKVEIQASLSINFNTIEFQKEYTNKIGTDTKDQIQLWEIYYLRARVVNSYGNGEWKNLANGIKIMGNTTGGFWIDDNNTANVNGYTKTTLVSLKNNLSGAPWTWIKIWRNSDKTGLIKSFDYSPEELFNLDSGDGNKTIYIETGIDNGISVTKEASIILDTILITGINWQVDFPGGYFFLRIFANEDVYRFKGQALVGTPVSWFTMLYWVSSEWLPPTNTIYLNTGETNMYEYRITYEDKAGNSKTIARDY